MAETAPPAQLRLRRLQSEALQRMTHVFAAAPFTLDQHLDERQVEALRIVQVDGAGSAVADASSPCRHRRVLQGTLTASGVSVTLLALARLAVASADQLADDRMMQKVSRTDPNGENRSPVDLLARR